jgi:hypothetical protein
MGRSWLDPREWEQHAVFRDTFLARFSQAEDRQALRHCGRMLYLRAMDYGEVCDAERTATADLAPVALDLHFLEAYLEDLARHPYPGTEGERLSALAVGWGRAAESLAQRIEMALAPGAEAGQPEGVSEALRGRQIPESEATAAADARGQFAAWARALGDVVERIEQARAGLPLPPEPELDELLLLDGVHRAYPAVALLGELDHFAAALRHQAEEMERAAAGEPGSVEPTEPSQER